MINIENTFKLEPYSLNANDKQRLLLDHLNALTKHHQQSCQSYKNFLDSNHLTNKVFSKIEDLPFLPVRVFKNLEVKSINNNDVFKTLTSSGTSGQSVSRIYLDKKTASYQTKALVKILQSFIGKKRIPMMIIDSDQVISNRSLFSARGAAIIGFSNFGKNKKYVLDQEMKIIKDEIVNFIKHYGSEDFLIFGFTYIVWEYFYSQLIKEGVELDLSKGILIHGGGWKKMQDRSVDNSFFKEKLQEYFNLSRIHNYYGMVEQVGSIFMECEKGYIHAPNFSEILIRDPHDWSIKNNNEIGLIELFSILPISYPGHVILSEDLGFIIDDERKCSCGREGKRFSIVGRVPQSEPRGCGDTFNS